ncbi:MAG: cysteine--tRNA ligase [Candidatus Omnitrophota bacterium]|nr:MAG: cysteine--tRNA ligase [Candidatus Omnitrophota bacterium]
MKIYNSLTKKKEEFIPLEKNKVGMYVCGPTVYDVSHIGHLRSAFVFDHIFRYFQYQGWEVTFVRNITDIDDKVIQRALQDLVKTKQDINALSLKKKVKEVSEYYTRLYLEDLRNFDLKTPHIQPKVTEHIPEIIVMIQKLLDKGMAYEAGGNVYFCVREFADYGKLSHQSVDQMLAGARVEKEQNKKDPLDFALWKKVKPDEPCWDSPWGSGRPGWHIECSAMSIKYLAETFDIHGGGRDLIFPHHENEIAQSQGATGKQFARYWIHNGLLTVEGEKMSKSRGNFITAKNILQNNHPETLKMLFLSSHYASPLDYSELRIKEAAKSRQRFLVFFQKVDELSLRCQYGKGQNNILSNPIIKDRDIEVTRYVKKFTDSMDDDFNTPKALSVLFDLVSLGNKIFTEQTIDLELKYFLTSKIAQILRELGMVLGLFLHKEEKMDNQNKEFINALMQVIIGARQLLKQKNNFETADYIRSQLQNIGILLEDNRAGASSWRMLDIKNKK